MNDQDILWHWKNFIDIQVLVDMKVEEVGLVWGKEANMEYNQRKSFRI